MTEAKPWQKVALVYAAGMIVMYLIGLVMCVFIGDQVIGLAAFVMTEVMRRQGKEIVENHSD